MVFTEEVFLYYFLPLCLLIYYLLPYRKNPAPGQTRYWLRNFWLTIASYAFYGWFEPWYVSLMWVSTIIDFGCGRYLGLEGRSQRSRKLALSISMISNLALLGFFKYGVFTQVNLNRLMELFDGPGFQVFVIILPIGISFYTFQTMSYAIDVYRGEKPVRSFADFSCFVSLFPQLIAGPILRYNALAEQLHSRRHSMEMFSRGIVLFMLGFAMKILLANPAGKIADPVFAAASPGMLDAWWGILAYAVQIYFDFNAYSCMAVGLGQMLGFEFLKNFDAPYHAESITDFWRRWHISLSTWLRDYLYIPLGGNRKGHSRTYINLALVMLLGGFWHGAQWQFIVWGAIHGGMLALERWGGKKAFYAGLPHWTRVGITMAVVLIAWVFFRAEDLPHAGNYIASMFGMGGEGAFSPLLAAQIYNRMNFAEMLLCLAIIYQPIQAYDFARAIGFRRVAVSLGLFAIGICMMYTQAFNPFLYFQF